MTRTTNYSLYALAGMATIALLSMILFASPMVWFGKRLLDDPFKTMVLLCLVTWLVLRTKNSLKNVQFNLTLFPALLFWVSVILFLLNEKYLGINIFSASLCIVASCSLLGMVIDRQRWIGLLAPFALLILMLPFEGYLDIYIGFPLRLFCADRVQEIFHIAGYPSLNQESIILIEGKAANVDLACSGIKGIWAGFIFFLLLTIIENYRISWRWFLSGAILLGLLLTENILRITILVFLDLILGLPLVADTIHLALGLLGFSLSCILTWIITKATCTKNKPREKQDTQQKVLPHPVSLTVFICFMLIALWMHQPYSPKAFSGKIDLHFPKHFNAKQVPLTSFEQRFFNENNAQIKKLTFTHEKLSGSAIIVQSKYWKGQHDPENCYRGSGDSIGLEGTWLLDNNSTVRFMQINNKKTATYWFQSSEAATGDYSSRVYNGIIHPQQTWLLVSILWKQKVNKDEIQDLIIQIQSDLTQQIRNGE